MPMLTVARGSTFQMMGQFLLDGQPLDISQWLGVKVTLSDYLAQQVFATLTTQITDPVNGVVTVSAADTSNWPIGRARIDCQVIDSTNSPYNSQCDYFRIVDSTLVQGTPVVSRS
jgi:hypothetical protein